MLSRLHACSALPSLHSYILPRRYDYIEPPDLRTSMSTSLDAPTALHTSIRPYIHVATPTSRLQILLSSIPPCFHICMPAAHRNRSIPPCLHVATPTSSL